MSQYVDRNEAQKSYRPSAGSMSPGLKRAREPYRFKNALLGLTLGAFAVGIWAYSISAVKQDVYDDVDDDVLGKGNSKTESDPSTTSQAVVTAIVPVDQTQPSLVPSVPTPTPSISSAPIPSPSPVLAALTSTKHKGVLPALAARSGRIRSILDPQNQTLVWGAPNVDQLGRMGDSKAA